MTNHDSNKELYTRKDTNSVIPQGEREYVLKVRDLPTEEKPREKLIQYGPEYLMSQELLAIVLNVGTRKEGVLEMSNRIMKEYGGKGIMSETDVKSLSKELDIPETKACQIVACFELGRRFFETKKGELQIVRTPKQVYDYVKDMHALPKEQLRGLYLDTHYRVIHDEVISIGSVDASIIHPREVFKPALERSASAVILVHNHPSGMVAPSTADIEVTTQLVKASKVLGINLLDHIVVTKDSYSSVDVVYL